VECDALKVEHDVDDDDDGDDDDDDDQVVVNQNPD